MEQRKACRAYPRFECEERIEIRGGKPLKPLSALMLNFSVSGSYFEISDPLRTGEMIVIKTADDAIFDPVSFGSREQRSAEVRWCLEIGKGDARKYGCGIAYVK